MTFIIEKFILSCNDLEFLTEFNDEYAAKDYVSCLIRGQKHSYVYRNIERFCFEYKDLDDGTIYIIAGIEDV